ncbi:hypothetical protein Acr_25g0007830 [Actinidia rufa]|uniref:Uncharacterized protein n=1 Tax=Actinidia rufa TaxID=165716 RepID=A0A7J0H0R9_9ERIC|nr:hypothetical protein Acr_25g0007830 [Actinidia rufa]
MRVDGSDAFTGSFWAYSGDHYLVDNDYFLQGNDAPNTLISDDYDQQATMAGVARIFLMEGGRKIEKVRD